MPVFVTEKALSIVFDDKDVQDGSTLSFYWPSLAVEGFRPTTHYVTFGGQKVDDNAPLSIFGENAVFELHLNSVLDDFWATSNVDLDAYQSGHPERLEFERNLESNPEFLTIMEHSSNKDEYNSATIASDLYKLSMAPVLRAGEEKVGGQVVTTFAVSFRTPGLEEMLLRNEKNILGDVIEALDGLKDRRFDHTIMLAAVEGKPFAPFWRENIEKICGPAHNPDTLIRNFRLPESSPDNFHGNTVIYNCQIGPEQVRDGKVAVAVFIKNGLHIEATGIWNKCTFLETTMMQAVYQVILEAHLRKRDDPPGRWLYEVLFRAHLSMKFAMEKSPKMKGALFAGRRTGHHMFTLLQTWYASRFYPNCFGTSSFDAWYTLSRKLQMPRIVPPVGTHAHELSMVFMCLFPELDENDECVPYSQAMAHYMYYRLVHQGYPGPMPMLPDTLGTGAFMKAAEKFRIHPMKDGVQQTHQQCFLLQAINSARQDSGTLEDFLTTLQEYPLFQGGKMASEIDTTTALQRADELGFSTFGAGGFFGDNEKVWPVTEDKKRFSLSMAVKAVRVFVDEKKTKVQPVKIGDDVDGGKVTCDSTLSKEEQKPVIDKGQRTKQAALHQPHSEQIVDVDEDFEVSFERSREKPREKPHEKVSDSPKKSRA